MGASWSNFKSKVTTTIKLVVLYSLIAIATLLVLFLVYKAIVGIIKKRLFSQIQELQMQQTSSGDDFLDKLRGVLQKT